MPLHYTLTGPVTGKKVAQTYKFTETVEVDLREIAAEEAPVAVSWAAARSPLFKLRPRNKSFELRGEDDRQFTRWFEGRQWVRLLVGHVDRDNGRSPDLTAEIFEARLSAGDCNRSLFGMDSGSEGKYRKVASAQYHLFESIKKDGRQEVFAAHARIERDTILVDGVVHIACRDPVIRLESTVGTTQGHDVPTVEAYNYEFDWFSHWNIDRPVLPLSMMEDALDICCANGFDRADMSALLPVVHLENILSKEQDIMRRLEYRALQAKNAGRMTEEDMFFFFHQTEPEARLKFVQSRMKLGRLADGGDFVAELVEILDQRSIDLPAFGF
jgi:hypothetical protein